MLRLEIQFLNCNGHFGQQSEKNTKTSLCDYQLSYQLLSYQLSYRYQLSYISASLKLLHKLLFLSEKSFPNNRKLGSLRMKQVPLVLALFVSMLWSPLNEDVKSISSPAFNLP
jgi:hypothetical protein